MEGEEDERVESMFASAGQAPRLSGRDSNLEFSDNYSGGPQAKNRDFPRIASVSDVNPVKVVPDETSCDAAAEFNSEERHRKVTPSAAVIKSGIGINLAVFQKYFPELERSQDSSVSLSSELQACKSLSTDQSICNPWEDDSSLDLRSKLSKSPVVVVPTAVQASESNTEDLNEIAMAISRDMPFLTASRFVEEPAPQVLGHTPPEKPEVMYTKTPSVDRLDYMQMHMNVAVTGTENEHFVSMKPPNKGH